jgi:hypothetical protein
VELATVRRDIDDLKIKVSEAKSRLQELEKDLRLREAALSPMRQMPVEVLGEIFSLALPDRFLDESGRQQLLNVSLVCRIWRDAALSARWLWGNVEVDHDVNPTSSKKIISWLRRAGNCPKRLKVATSFCADEAMDCSRLGSECKSRNASLAKLLTDGPTLDHLELFNRGPKCFWNLVEALHLFSAVSKPQTLPWHCLRSLKMNFESEWDEPENEFDSAFLHIPYSVTSLDISLPSASVLVDDTFILPLHLPLKVLHQLTCLTFASDWDGNLGLLLLKHCHNLETLTLEISNHAPFGVISSELPNWIICLPNLRTLRLRRLSPASVNVFRFLRTPNLVSLDIEPWDCGPDSDLWAVNPSFLENVPTFINQSLCHGTLRQLSLHTWPFMDDGIATLLRALPSVTHLTLHGVRDVTFFRNFHSPKVFLPDLEVLELLELDPRFPIKTVLAFLNVRRPLMERCSDGSLVYSRLAEDKLKKVMVTWQKVWRPRAHKGDELELVNGLRRWDGLSISLGPREYDEA